MSFRNSTRPSALADNSIAAGFGVKKPTAAASESTIQSRFKNAAPRDRVAIVVSNVPGIKNGHDEFAVRVWRDSSVPGGYGISVNCLRATRSDFEGAFGKQMVEKYVRSSKAEDLGVDNEQLGKKVADILASTKNRFERMELLDKLAGSTIVIDPKLIDQLHTSLKQTIAAGIALLAPLPKGA